MEELFEEFLAKNKGIVASKESEKAFLDDEGLRLLSFMVEKRCATSFDRSACNFAFLTVLRNKGSVVIHETIVILHEKIGVNEAKSITKEPIPVGVKHAIIISVKPVSFSAKKLLHNYLKDLDTTACMLKADFAVDISKHCLVNHCIEVIADEEINCVLKAHYAKQEQLPRMGMDDPVSRLYGLKKGSIVKAYRASTSKYMLRVVC
jgi:DNA-directed RNA polymerase subunit H (RpoH/RPB5)